MINHILHYFGKGFFYTWTMQLPFRLNKGDQIHNELLDNIGVSEHKEEQEDKWVEISVNNEYFEVEYIQIDHNANVVAWLMLPNFEYKTLT